MSVKRPKRIQRSSKKGWKIPEGAVYVGRPTEWRNPFQVGGWYQIGTQFSGAMRMTWCRSYIPGQAGFTLMESKEQCVEWFRIFAERYLSKRVEELRGKDLACWCRLDCVCHADVLLELANRQERQPHES